MPSEKTIQKALGTLQKFEVTLNVSFTYSLSSGYEIIEALDKEDAKIQFLKLLKKKSIQKKILHVIADDAFDAARDYGEFIAQTLDGPINKIPNLQFDLNSIKIEPADPDEDLTLE